MYHHLEHQCSSQAVFLNQTEALSRNFTGYLCPQGQWQEKKTEQTIRCLHTINLRCLQLLTIPLSGLHSLSADSELIIMTFPYVPQHIAFIKTMIFIKIAKEQNFIFL